MCQRLFETSQQTSPKSVSDILMLNLPLYLQFWFTNTFLRATPSRAYLPDIHQTSSICQ